MSDGPIIPSGTVLSPMEADPPRRAKAETTDRISGKRRKTARGRFAVLNGFVDCSMASMSGSEVAVWLVLYRDTRNGTARTSAVDIARRIGRTPRTVIDSLGKLRTRGLVTRVYRGGLNRGPSVYRVHPVPP